MPTIDETLTSLDIPFERVEHAALHMCEEAYAAMPDRDTVHTKNLFLRDKNGEGVELYVDREVWHAPFWRCHPLVKTATLLIPRSGIDTFLLHTGHEARVVELR